MAEQHVEPAEAAESRSKRRKLTGIQGTIIFGAAVLMSIFQLYYSTFGLIDVMAFRSGHLMFAMVLIFALYPARKNSPRHRMSFFDLFLLILALVIGFYIIYTRMDLVYRHGDPIWSDILLGTIATVLTLEIARRTTGWALASVGAGFLLYAYFGPYFPGVFSHVGFPIPRMAGTLYLTTDGIYGIPLGVMTSYVFLFILFASFLHSCGAGDFFIKLAYALTGRFRGGPAKTAIVASGMMGTISGSATANVVTTGAFTIPLMKKTGYTSETAGAIEVAASVGGQLTPPVMGAGAFIMSEWTGIPYLKVIGVAFIPAIMYYLSVGFYAHVIACKRGLKPIPKGETPELWPIIKKGYQFLFPIAVLIVFLIIGFSPMMSAIYAMVTMVGLSYIRKETRMSVKDIYNALGRGAINAVLVSASLACAGIIMCAVGLTGLGLKFSSVVIKASGGHIGLALLFVGIASLFLGMELPITAAYIMCAVLSVPALKAIGIPLLTAHMIVFWFSMDSAVTPPVCVSAYAAAGISGGRPMKTGIQAWKLAKGLYIIPVLMAFTKLLTGSIIEMLIVAIPGTLGLFCFAVIWEGFFIKKMSLFERAILACATGLLFYSHIYSYLLGLVLFTVVVLTQWFTGKKVAAENGSRTLSDRELPPE
jgi:TRAP transporter 4TM/12TM fusion protein